MGEEQRKARLLVRHPEQKALLHRLEDTRYLRGRISFALDCVNADEEPENFDFEQLGKVATVIENEFGQGITSEIRRAFFTIGDGGFYREWYSWFYIVDLPKYRLICDDREFRSFTEPWHSSRSLLKSFVLALIGNHYIALDEEGVLYPINGQRPRNNPARKRILEANKIQ